MIIYLKVGLPRLTSARKQKYSMLRTHMLVTTRSEYTLTMTIGDPFGSNTQRAHAVWCQSKIKNLDYPNDVYFFATITKHSNLLLLDSMCTVSIKSLCLKVQLYLVKTLISYGRYNLIPRAWLCKSHLPDSTYGPPACVFFRS